MTFARDLLLTFSFVLGGSLAAFPQSKSPETALEEVATADKLDALAHHLPLAIEENIARLNPVQKAALEEEIVVPRILARSGQFLHKRDDRNGWDLQFPGESEAHTVRVKTTFYSGSEALLLLERESQDGMVALVSMRYEDSEWRVTDFGFLHMMGVEARLHDKVRPTAAQETEIVNALETIAGALTQYAVTYSHIGFPTTLQVLGPDPNAKPESSDSAVTDSSATTDTDEEQSETPQPLPEQHAGLLDASLISDPLIIRGYRFHYTLIAARSSNETSRLGQFSITATPADFGKNGSRSFYVDESGVIRFTDDNRDATANDPPLQRRTGYEYQYWLR